MSRLIKEKIVTELSHRYQGITNCICVNYQPLNALQANDLRAYLAEDGLRINILKNSLARRIFQQVKLDAMEPFLDGPTALVFAPAQGEKNDPVLLARKLVTWRKKHKKLKIKGGLLEGKVVDPTQIGQIAILPTREAMLSQIAATLNAPLSRLAMSLKGIINKLGYGLKSLVEKKDSGKPQQ